jgi:hypothetical protein
MSGIKDIWDAYYAGQAVAEDDPMENIFTEADNFFNSNLVLI